jgi:hypothetical protein
MRRCRNPPRIPVFSRRCRISWVLTFFVYVSVVRRLLDDNAAMQEAGILPAAERIKPALLQVVGQLREKSLAVLIATKDIGAAVAAAGDMLRCVGKIHAWWTWHAYR